MTGARGARGPSGGRRIGRRIGQMLLALLLVFLLIWGLLFLRALVLRPHAAQQEATAGLEWARAELAGLSAEDAAALDAEFGQRLGTTRTVHCGVEPSDAGWWTVDHRNTCTLREIEVRAVPAAMEEPAGVATALLADVSAWQGEPAYLVVPDPRCDPAAEARVEADAQSAPFRSDIDLAAVVVEGLPALREGCLDEPGPSHRAVGAVSLELPESAPPAEGAGARLVVVREARLSDTSLGCLPLPIFCQPAVDEPQLPDALKG
ncbi:hypothetical protein CFK38_07335 [Brachybacterium vulturis]|uniref:Uncharacterized protein n=1 Tax=Brachybacterium vulturis TaxID=2017484 RepID=A0A291GMP9_9MICO|nr:hypothetical protein [Brachybacterium vulturis]ATG51360.1 hypothetical protein CFK38_07335 [Brachybacterium vulturis]